MPGTCIAEALPLQALADLGSRTAVDAHESWKACVEALTQMTTRPQGILEKELSDAAIHWLRSARDVCERIASDKGARKAARRCLRVSRRRSSCRALESQHSSASDVVMVRSVC